MFEGLSEKLEHSFNTKFILKNSMLNSSRQSEKKTSPVRINVKRREEKDENYKSINNMRNSYSGNIRNRSAKSNSFSLNKSLNKKSNFNKLFNYTQCELKSERLNKNNISNFKPAVEKLPKSSSDYLSTKPKENKLASSTEKSKLGKEKEKTKFSNRLIENTTKMINNDQLKEKITLINSFEHYIKGDFSLKCKKFTNFCIIKQILTDWR